MIECGDEIGGNRLIDLDYRNEIRVLACNMNEIQVMIDNLVTEGSKICLKIDTAKAELMKNRAQDTRCLSMGASNLNEADNFV